MTSVLIKRAVAEAFGVSEKLMSSRAKHKSVVEARWAVMVVCRDLLGMSINQCARVVGFRDHTSAMYGLRQADKFLAADARLAHALSMLERVKSSGLNKSVELILRPRYCSYCGQALPKKGRAA